eukprot:SAG31_NODE_14438_length_806_cov_1.742574_1_plen_193_part_01
MSLPIDRLAAVDKSSAWSFPANIHAAVAPLFAATAAAAATISATINTAVCETQSLDHASMGLEMHGVQIADAGPGRGRGCFTTRDVQVRTASHPRLTAASQDSLAVFCTALVGRICPPLLAAADCPFSGSSTGRNTGSRDGATPIRFARQHSASLVLAATASHTRQVVVALAKVAAAFACTQRHGVCAARRES